MHKPLPTAGPETGLTVLKGLARDRSLLTAMEIMRDEVGPAFQITLPGFRPAVLVGPDSNRQIMVSRREHFRWRSPSDPVTKLLRHGVLVEDGEKHDCLRAQMEPVLQKSQVVQHIPAMQATTDRVLADWADGSVRDMLVEMRRVALLIFMGTLLDVEFGPDLERMWGPILRTIKYISPGLWIVWPDVPRPGYQKALAQMDDYLFGIIRDRRRRLETGRLETDKPQSPIS
jgi:cytochrome P450